MDAEPGYLRIATEEVTARDALPVDAAAKKAFFQGIAEQVYAR